MIVLPAPTPGDQSGVRFRQAKCYRWGRRGNAPIWVVIHTAECGETHGAAEALQDYAATMADGRQASWHYAVDDDSATQSVRESDAAFHAPPLNDLSIGVECAAKASQDEAGWSDTYSRTMIAWRLVPLVAAICARWGIPVCAVDDETLRGGVDTARSLVARKADADEWQGLRSHNGGIIGHAQVSRAFKKSSHYDPGPAFPWAEFLARVASAAGGPHDGT